MTTFLARLMPWYDPAEQAQRERRTGEARNKAIQNRIRAEGVGEHVLAVQRSYEQADARIIAARARKPRQHA
jgi:hypothetical protein